MADLRDEHGNPIQLTDQYGKPVQLTDEFGNPMHLTGVATTNTAGLGAAMKHESYQPEPAVQQQEQLRRSGSSSSSSSSEEDGQGVRRKKGLKERIKDTIGGGTNAPPSKTSTTVPGQATEHEKKGLMEKIKEKLPGHHHYDH
ncbi:Plant dehydrin [Orobanche gracilis]